jgi:hypothetical protein
VLFYGLRGLCVGRVDQFDRFRCEAPGRIRFDFWSGLRFLERAMERAQYTIIFAIWSQLSARFCCNMDSIEDSFKRITVEGEFM